MHAIINNIQRDDKIPTVFLVFYEISRDKMRYTIFYIASVRHTHPHTHIHNGKLVAIHYILLYRYIIIYNKSKHKRRLTLHPY